MPSTGNTNSNTKIAATPATATDLIRQACAESLRALKKYRAAVLRIEEEPIHQMRVGTRRLRAILTIFSGIMDAQWAGELAAELRWLAHSLGTVRDYDILRERLRAAAHDDDRQTLGKLHRILAQRHREAQDALKESLKSERYIALVERLRIGSLSPETTIQAGEPPLIILLPMISGAWNKISRAANKLRQNDAPEKFHRVRKMAKRLRYATESVIQNLDKDNQGDATKFVKRMKEIQDTLGEHQDAVVAAKTVELIIEKSESSPFTEAARRLIATENKAAKKSRKDFLKNWKNASDPKIRKWMKQ
jgi:CHAD domain-containing protein